MNKILHLSLRLIFWVFVMIGATHHLSAQTAPPNVVIILADDLGYGDVAFNNCPDFDTPNLDILVANGGGPPTSVPGASGKGHGRGHKP